MLGRVLCILATICIASECAAALKRLFSSAYGCWIFMGPEEERAFSNSRMWYKQSCQLRVVTQIQQYSKFLWQMEMPYGVSE